MSTTQQPEALRLADALERPGYGWHSTPAQCAAELRRLRAENETLQQGYAAARLEIESLQRRVQEVGAAARREHERADRAMRAAQPAGAQQPGEAYAALFDALSQHDDSCDDFAEAVQRVRALRAEVERLTRAESARVDALALRASHWQAPAQAAPAAVAGPSEFPHAQMDAMALARYKVVPSHESMFHRHAVTAGDGSQQLYIGREVECENMARKFAGAFLDGAFAFHLMLAAAPTTQPAPANATAPSYDTLQLYKDLQDLWAEANAVDTVIGRPEVLMAKITKMRDAVGQMAATYLPAPQQEAQEPVAPRPYNPTEAMRRAAKRIDPALTHDQIRALWCSMWSAAPQPSPASQGDALDAEQHEIDARHAAIYRWMLSHVADVLSIFDNWFADEEADTDELHDALAARAAQEGITAARARLEQPCA